MQQETLILQSIPVDPLTGAVSVPIYQTSTFAQEAPGVNKGFDYSRSNNPTRKALEGLLAKLENGSGGFAFASGLAAVDAVIKLLSAGDHVLAVDDIYGGTFRIFDQIYSRLGLDISYVDTTDLQLVADSIRPETRLIWLETPTNPTLKVSDIAALAAIAHANNALLVVDNTFASPALQRPLDLGADIIIHSVTKYLSGHSDVIAGAVVVKDAELAGRIKFIQNATGSILAPFDSWLTIRGIETLGLRVRQQSESALQIAHFLEDCPAVDKVFYPGLATHRNHTVAARQQRAAGRPLFGGVVSFTLKENSIQAAEAVVCNTRLFHLAESLGGVKSLIAHPAQMTHKSIPAEKRRAAGVDDSLIRLSVGLEHPADLIADIEQALSLLSIRPVKQKAFSEVLI